MAPIRRPFTETEWAAVKAALPPKLKPIMDQVEFIQENCWGCTHYDGYEGQPGKCLQFDCDIPNDQRGKKQTCFEMRVTPF